MFLGTFFHSIDDKNRVMIPAKFRQLVQKNECYISKSFDMCLEIRLKSDFEDWFNKLTNIGSARKDARALRRKILANSEITICDSVGRLKISDNLIKTAKINKNVVILGNGEKFEIWDAKVWTIYQNETVNIEDIADEFSEKL